MHDLSLVHLVWHNLGMEPFRRFVESYRRHEAGIAHDLVLVFKEFPDEQLHNPYYEVMAELPFQALSMPGSWLDIPAYFTVADYLDSQYLCLLNSNSEIKCDGWMSKLHDQLIRPEVGVVGATGSRESLIPLPGNGGEPPAAIHPLREEFDPFPNDHLRTNAFMARRELMLSFPWRPGNAKWDCWRFESGKQGMTREILSRGLVPLVIGRDGRGYDREHWAVSRTFRVGEQENLLVADNQTRDYANATLERRKALTSLAWGDSAT